MLNTLATFRGVSVVLEWTYMSMKMVHHLVWEDLSFGIQYREYTIHAEIQLKVNLDLNIKMLKMETEEL